MITERQFKDLGYSTAQIGFYLMTMKPELFVNNDLHRTMVSMLSQMSLYLNDLINNKTSKDKGESKKSSNIEYISRKEVVKMYHPLITEYGLTQAINKNELKYIKRGSKYFFEPNEVKKWIENKSSESNKISNYKFV